MNSSSWIPVPGEDRQLEQEYRVKRSRVFCTAERSPANAYYFIQNIAGVKASQLGLDISNCPCVVEMKDGGYKDAIQLGVLYQYGPTDIAPTPQHSKDLPKATTSTEAIGQTDTDRESEDRETCCSESSKSNSGWTYSKTVLLIELYREHVDDFKNPVLKKKEVWHRISLKMKGKGYDIGSEMCDKKWRALVYRYKTIRDANQQTGQGRKRWEFFDLMDDVLAGDPSVKPALTISSSEGVMHNENTEIHEGPPGTPTSSPTKRPASTGPPSSTKKRRQAKPPIWLDQIIQAQNAQVDRLETVAKEYNNVQMERNNILRDLLNKM